MAAARRFSWTRSESACSDCRATRPRPRRVPAVPEAELDAAEARDVASVVGHLIDAGAEQVLDGLDEAGWWEMWAEGPSAYAELYFATEGQRGVLTPALAGFIMRLLAVADPATDT